MRYRLLIHLPLIWVLLASAAPAGDVAPAGADGKEKLRGMKLLLTFQGKGSSLPYDAGVVKRAFQCIPALGDGQVIVAGNSSGSIFAIYYSCFGFTETSIDYAEYRIKHADTSAIRGNENVPRKAASLLRNRPTEIPHIALAEYIAFALGVQDWKGARDVQEIVRKSRSVPRHPVVIVAANKEVLDNRAEGHVLSSKDHKVFDPGDFSVSWKRDVFDFYQRRPAQFEKDYPDLRLGADPYIGKACTCFVDQSMFDLLRRIPAEERLCDLRLMTDPQDMALAILASVAEPSYFAPVAETRYEKLLVGDTPASAGNSKRRSYCGGFLIPLVAQDVRRMLPSVRVLGTGVARVPLLGRQLVKAWYLVDLQPAADLNAWWTDMEISIPRAVQYEMIRRVLSAEEEFQRGFDRASECFELDLGLPKYVVPPKYGSPAARAIFPPGAPVEFIEDPPAPGDRPGRLKTMRGLGPLLRPAGAPSAD